ncbi:EamA family transporter [Catenulispora sp. NF23]|uniref:EamA family transporter n=1 Tax=Catenulispora pinistramenti TaxID=2705254 RepID=A0ABS5KIT3_9ACTN|nr:EamA family transporter [Catenulispora pinistramenti]MBS2532589.1 EamA family transporter [Catenulispora pinistramenti]MBS2546303.1 EamA family transporter [Catenulispora pinistramenti]
MTSTRSANRTTAGVLFGVTSSVAFGAGGPFAKALIAAGFSPLQAVWVRLIGTVVVLVALCLVLRRPGQLAMMVRNKWQILLYGVVAVAACQSLYFVAASRLPVGIAILLEFTGPVLVVAWEKLVRHAHVARESAIGVGVAMLGLAVVVQIWSGLHLDAIGIAAGLGAAAGNATFFLLIDRLRDSVDPLTLTTGGMAVGMVVLTPLAAPWSAPWHILGHSVPLGSHHVPGWTLALFIVLISTILSYLTGAAAIQRLSAPVAAGLAYVEPASATVIAWATLGERLAPIQIGGGAIVLAGAFLAQRGIGQTTRSEGESTPSILGTTVTTEALIR